MKRGIDKHEPVVKRFKPNTSNHTKINVWRKAWLKCQSSIEQWGDLELKNIDYVLERWIPILNKTFDNPLSDLHNYEIFLYIYENQNGPREIITFWVNDKPNPRNVTYVYIIFNSNEFRKVVKYVLECLDGKNDMYVDEARGTINISHGDSECRSRTDHAIYHRIRIIRYLLFVYTLHGLAHLHMYSIYKHSFFDNHKYLSNSPFFKLYYSGYISR